MDSAQGPPRCAGRSWSSGAALTSGPGSPPPPPGLLTQASGAGAYPCSNAGSPKSLRVTRRPQKQGGLWAPRGAETQEPLLGRRLWKEETEHPLPSARPHSALPRVTGPENALRPGGHIPLGGCSLSLRKARRRGRDGKLTTKANSPVLSSAFASPRPDPRTRRVCPSVRGWTRPPPPAGGAVNKRAQHSARDPVFHPPAPMPGSRTTGSRGDYTCLLEEPPDFPRRLPRQGPRERIAP